MPQSTPAAPPRVRMHPGAVAALLAALTVVAWLVLRHAGTSYDLEYHLAWGRGVWDGHKPGFDFPGAPSEHPLTLIVAALADLVPGIGQHQILHASAYLAFAGLLVAVLLLGAELFSWAAGLLAAAALAISPPMEVTTAIAFQDVSATAFVVLAVLLAVRHPQRPVPPLVALGLGGLLRPEIWGLAAVFWLYSCRGRDARERLRLAAVAAAAPLIWTGMDLLVTGNPLFSFTATREGAAVAKRTTGIGEAPRLLVSNVRHTVEVVVLAGGVGGVFGALVLNGPLKRLQRPGRELAPTVAIALAALVLSALAFLVLGLSRLSLLDRYVFTTAALLALFFGFAVTSAWHLRGPLAVAAALVGAAGLASAIYIAPREFDTTRGARRFTDQQYRALHGLERLVARRDARAALGSCPVVAVSSYRTRPFLANDLDRQPWQIALADAPGELPARGAYVVPADRDVRDVLLLIGRRGGPLPPPPPGFHVAARSDTWAVLARGCGPARSAA